jgi:hypothetical protein
MNRSVFPALGGALLAMALAVPAQAQTYNGDNSASVLQTVQMGGGFSMTNALAPTGSNATNPGKSDPVSGNSVTVQEDAGTPAVPVWPSYALGAVNFADDEALHDNEVFIKGGKLGYVYGAYHGTLGGASANASNNTVTLIDGEVNLIWGGNADSATSATASDNVVDIQGGTVSDAVYGGEANSDGTANAENNTVRISGTPNLSTARIYGGFAFGVGTLTSSNNLLQLATTGLTVWNVDHFQKLEIQWPAIPAAGTPVLSVTNSATFGANTPVTITATPALTPPPGSAVVLVRAAPLNGTFTPAVGVLNGQAYTLDKNGNDLVLTVRGVLITTPAGALPGGTVGTDYSAALAALGPATTWAVSSGALPDGLALDNTGKITGKPTKAGTFNFEVTVSPAAGGASAPVAYSITILALSSGMASVPTLGQTALALLAAALGLLAAGTLRRRV